MPALIRRFHDVKLSKLQNLRCQGGGNPRREFLHVDDLDNAGSQHLNTGIDISIKELARLVAEVVGFNGQIEWDPSKRDGTSQNF